MDGFAYAGEALAGRYIGAKNQTALRNTVHHLFYWGLGLSLIFTILYAIGGKEFLGLLTNDTSVINASDTYFYWALIIPLAGFSAFLWDGVFIGATATRQMLYSMLVASASFFGVYYARCNIRKDRSRNGNRIFCLFVICSSSQDGIIQLQTSHCSALHLIRKQNIYRVILIHNRILCVKAVHRGFVFHASSMLLEVGQNRAFYMVGTIDEAFEKAKTLK